MKPMYENIERELKLLHADYAHLTQTAYKLHEQNERMRILIQHISNLSEPGLKAGVAWREIQRIHIAIQEWRRNG